MRSLLVAFAACAMAVAGCRTPRASRESDLAPAVPSVEARSTSTPAPTIAPAVAAPPPATFSPTPSPATPLPDEPITSLGGAAAGNSPRVAWDLPPVIRPVAAIVPLESYEAAGAIATYAEPLPSEPSFAGPRPAEAIGGSESAATPVAEPLRLDLIQSLETALLQNPDLTALRRNEGVSVAAVGVARTYPFNPFVQIQATPFQHAKYESPGTVYHYGLLMQQIQLGGQQRFREENALAALNSVRWNIVQAELSNVAQTERLYFTTLYLRGIRELAEAGVRLNDELLRILEKRLEAGDAAAADVAIVRLDNRAARQQARLAESNYRTALLDLKRHLNLPIAMAFEPAGDLSEWEWLSPLPPQTPRANPSEAADYASETATSVAASLTASRPDVLAARSDLAAARANAGLARSSRRPDLQIGPYYQRTESGTTYLGFRAQTDIPVLNNGMPLVRQREAEVRQRHAVWQQLQIRAQLEAEAAIDRYERARQSIAESGPFSDSLPTELERLERQFLANEVDFLRVVTARTSLITARRAQLDLLNEAAQAAAAVTAASGLPPESILRLSTGSSSGR
jgi:outer membrane protein, heavy metal efflux system